MKLTLTVGIESMEELRAVSEALLGMNIAGSEDAARPEEPQKTEEPVKEEEAPKEETKEELPFEPDEAPAVPTLADTRKAVGAYRAKHGKEDTLALLAKYGAKSASTLAEDKRAAFIAEVENE